MATVYMAEIHNQRGLQPKKRENQGLKSFIYTNCNIPFHVYSPATGHEEEANLHGYNMESMEVVPTEHDHGGR